MFKQKINKAQATTEYIALVVFIIASLILFQKYIARAFYGRWKRTGESLAQGMQYDPHYTTECAYDILTPVGGWYNQRCFEEHCLTDCYSVQGSVADCQACIHPGCESPLCN